MPSYTGAGRSRCYQRQKDLREAAKGCSKITSFFKPTTTDGNEPTGPTIAALTDAISSAIGREPSPMAIPAVISAMDDTSSQSSCASDHTSSTDDSGSATDDIIPSTTNYTPSTSTSHSTAHSMPSGISKPGATLGPVSFLDMAEDDDDAAESTSVAHDVAKLIHDAKKFKSFSTLFYLNSLR